MQKYHLSKKYHYQDCVFLIIGISVYLPTYYVFNTTKKHAEHFVILSANQVYQLSLNLFFLCSIRLSKMDIFKYIVNLKHRNWSTVPDSRTVLFFSRISNLFKVGLTQQPYITTIGTPVLYGTALNMHTGFISNVFLGTIGIVVWIVGCQGTVRVCVENRVLHLKIREI